MTSFKAKFPPGPRQRPLTGNAHNVKAGQNTYKSLWDHREKYGKVSYFRLGGKDFISLNTYEAAHEALESPETSQLLMNRPPGFLGDYPLRGDITFPPYSEDWHHFRCAAYKGIMSTIHQSKEVMAALNDEFDHMRSAFRDNNGKSFNPRKIMNLSITNSLITTLVGRRFEYDHPVISLYQEYAVNMTALFKARIALGAMPWLRHLPCGYRSQYSNVLRSRRELAKYLLHDIKKESENDREERVGMIYELLRAQKTYNAIKDENIEAMIVEVHTAGVDNMAAQLVTLLYSLLYHPHIQAGVYREIVEVLGKNETPCVEDQQRMPYTTATILELMRRATNTPLSLPRSTVADMTLFDYQIPKDTVVFVNLWKIQHDEETWGDPWAFRPERLLDTDGKLLPKDHKFMRALMPFGVGGRSCLGEAFGASRLFLYLVNILQSFEVYNDALKPGFEIDPRDYTRQIVLDVPPFELFVRERP